MRIPQSLKGIQVIDSGLKYPVLEVLISDPATGKIWLMANCCFQDLMDPIYNDFELAGMGVAIIGNICQAIQSGALPMRCDAVMQIRHGENSPPIPMPWPGMLDDKPVKLNLADMPFDPTMFLDTSKYQFKTRIDRLALVDRVQATWLPYLKSKIAFGGVQV